MISVHSVHLPRRQLQLRQLPGDRGFPDHHIPVHYHGDRLLERVSVQEVDLSQSLVVRLDRFDAGELHLLDFGTAAIFNHLVGAEVAAGDEFPLFYSFVGCVEFLHCERGGIAHHRLVDVGEGKLHERAEKATRKNCRRYFEFLCGARIDA